MSDKPILRHCIGSKFNTCISCSLVVKSGDLLRANVERLPATQKAQLFFGQKHSNAALPAARTLVYFRSELPTEWTGVPMQSEAASVPSAGDRSNKSSFVTPPFARGQYQVHTAL
jgi:hypothetical protein